MNGMVVQLAVEEAMPIDIPNLMVSQADWFRRLTSTIIAKALAKRNAHNVVAAANNSIKNRKELNNYEDSSF